MTVTNAKGWAAYVKATETLEEKMKRGDVTDLEASGSEDPPRKKQPVKKVKTKQAHNHR